jgi:hypothetical protein
LYAQYTHKVYNQGAKKNIHNQSQAAKFKTKF